MNSEKKVKFDIKKVALITIGIICISIAGFQLYNIYSDYKVAEDTYNQLEDEFVQIPASEEQEENKYTEHENSEHKPVETPWHQKISVNLSGLHEKYPHIVGWIFFENESISYPVIHSDDNNRYLRTTYDGKSASAGCIFIEATHSPDFSDTHTIVYGHNMRNLSMFGKLKYYKDKKGYYDTHQYFQIFTGNEIRRYQIFAYQDVSVTSFVYQDTFSSAKVLADKLLENSKIKPDIEIKAKDKIITLSTCTTDDDHRFVVSAVLVERYSITDKALIED